MRATISVVLLATAGCVAEGPSEVEWRAPQLGENGYGTTEENPIFMMAFPVDYEAGVPASDVRFSEDVLAGMPLIPEQAYPSDEVSDPEVDAFGLQVVPPPSDAQAGLWWIPVGMAAARAQVDPRVQRAELAVLSVLSVYILIPVQQRSGALLERGGALLHRLLTADVPGLTLASDVTIAAEGGQSVVLTREAARTIHAPGCESSGPWMMQYANSGAPITVTFVQIGMKVCATPRLIGGAGRSVVANLVNRTSIPLDLIFGGQLIPIGAEGTGRAPLQWNQLVRGNQFYRPDTILFSSPAFPSANGLIMR